MEAAIDFPPVTRQKLDRLTVKRTANSKTRDSRRTSGHFSHLLRAGDWFRLIDGSMLRASPSLPAAIASGHHERLAELL
jgi:hypothetical protein